MAEVLLSGDRIVDEALALAAEVGIDGLTMRAVATRLDVTAMALYRYVGDRDGLVRSVVDRIGAQVTPASVGDPADRVRAWAHAQHTTLRRYPGAAAWLVANGPAGGEAYRLLDGLASSLLAAGLDDHETARGCALVMSWTFTRVAVEDAAAARHSTGTPSRSRQFLAGLDAVDASIHPSAAAVGPEFFRLGASATFEAGLEALLRGLGVVAAAAQ